MPKGQWCCKTVKPYETRFRKKVFPLSMRFLCMLLLLPAMAWAQSSETVNPSQSDKAQSGTQDPTSSSPQLPEAQSFGNIHGTILDGTGAAVAGARVQLTHTIQPLKQEVVSDGNGQFSFTNVAPGEFHLSIAASGFAPFTFSGSLQTGQILTLPQFTLAIATAVTEVQVGVSAVEVAQEQIRDQEKQRVLGVIPNFYVSYVPDAAPLNTKQKFELAWKTAIDPVTFGLIGVVAGIQQAQNEFSDFGQGAQGYGKRYGAAYANFAAGTFIGGAILPSLLKQDPRYFYKGTGTKRSRFLYAVAASVICKGDNGRWQPNYSNILGNLAAGGISNLYYPEKDRSGVKLTFENALIGIGATAGINLIEEFIIPKLTPGTPKHAPSKP